MREVTLPSGELFHHVLNGLSLGIVPGLVGSKRWADLQNWLFLDLGLSGRRTRGASEDVEWSGKLE